MPKRYSLDLIIDNLKYPARGEDLLGECIVQRLPSDVCKELSKRLENEEFNSPDDIHEWFLQNITSDLAHKLGAKTVHDLITRGRRAA